MSHPSIRRHSCGEFKFGDDWVYEIYRRIRVRAQVELTIKFGWTGTVLAMPGISQHENVGEALGRIDSGTKEAASDDTPGTTLQRDSDIAVYDISSEEPDHAEIWGNNVVDKAVGA